jgi:hypothetical protein
MDEVLAACTQQISQQSSVALRDWLQLIAIVAGIGSFIWKLNADTRMARYRETIGFLEKRTQALEEGWKAIKVAAASDADYEELAKKMFAMLDTAALLVRDGGFDKALIYNYWWHYFVHPMRNDKVAQWITDRNRKDRAVLEHFLDLNREFGERSDREERGEICYWTYREEIVAKIRAWMAKAKSGLRIKRDQ